MEVLYHALCGAGRAQGHHRGLRALRLAAHASGGAQLRHAPRPSCSRWPTGSPSTSCTHVAMEATGVYWKPVWHVLEGDFELVLANATHIKNVPGRKTDVNDATWIADLLAHGLIRSQLRAAAGRSRSCVTSRARASSWCARCVAALQRIQKVLRGRQPQARLGAHRRHWARAAERCSMRIVAGETDPAAAGRAGSGTARHKARRAARGAARARDRAPPLPAQAAPAGQSMRCKRTLAELDRGVGKALGAVSRQRARLLTTMPGVC